MKKKKLSIKLWIMIVLSAFVVFGCAFDIVRAQTFDIEVVSVSPDPVIADGEAQCEVVVQVNDISGKPVKGHILYASIIKSGANFIQRRNTTDENGQVALYFRPLRASKYNPATNVTIAIEDESNSIFFLIPAKLTFEVQVRGE